MRRSAPVWTLLFLAPFVAEVLFGATPLSRLPLFFAQVGLYGGGALLARELVRRRGLHPGWLPALGLAYGLVEEGLVLQSLFNPGFPGLGILGAYGRAAGVNWVWAEFILGYHAVFSITLPVVLAELMFPERAREPWLSGRGLGIVAAAFVIDGLLLARGLARWSGSAQAPTPPGLLLLCGAVAGALVSCALRATPSGRGEGLGHPAPGAWRLRLAGLFGALSWFGVRLFVVGDGHQLPAWAALVAWPGVAALVALAVRRWSVPAAHWPPSHVYALAAGALPASWLFGVLIVAVSSPAVVVDLAGHLLFGLAFLVTLRSVRRRLRRTPGCAPEPQPPAPARTARPLEGNTTSGNCSGGRCEADRSSESPRAAPGWPGDRGAGPSCSPRSSA
jgi:hypothetical protein